MSGGRIFDIAKWRARSYSNKSKCVKFLHVLNLGVGNVAQKKGNSRICLSVQKQSATL
jgi:hypothetical protein